MVASGLPNLEGLGCLMAPILAPAWAIVWLIDRAVPVDPSSDLNRRIAIYAGSGLALFIPLALVLVFVWGFTGPGWAASPPELIGSILQIAITLAYMGLPLYVERRLVRIEHRDWWLGVVVAWPWFLSVAAAIATGPSSGWGASFFIGALALAIALVCASGPLLVRTWKTSSAVARLQAWIDQVKRDRSI
jgi:hypothetical protein